MVSLATRSALFYWRGHLGLLAGVALTAAVITGALLVGDSVRGTLRDQASQRLGPVTEVVLGGDRLLTADLADRLSAQLAAPPDTPTPTVAPALFLVGTASSASGEARANNTQIIGVDPRFFALASPSPSWTPAEGEVALGGPLALRLGVGVGDSVLLRVSSPGAISRDAPLSGSTESEVTLRRKVAAILPPEEFGLFSLQAEQEPALNAYLSLADLAAAVDAAGKANLFLTDHGDGTTLARALPGAIALEDYGLTLAPLPTSNTLHLETSRVFLDPPIVDALAELAPEGVVTYLVNSIEGADPASQTPYSMVAATDSPPAAPPQAGAPAPPATSAHPQATISSWLAEDLGLAPGDPLTIRYFTMGAGRSLAERQSTFTVAAVLPMDSPGLDPSWTPVFPGVNEAGNCRDWDPGFSLDLDAIRDKDEDYWDDYGSTPKVFIPLDVGQEIWGNRFGALTSLRFPATVTADQVRQVLHSNLPPGTLGITARDVRSEAAAAVDGSMDIGMLFLSASFFLILAALLLASLLFAFLIEGRAGQLGILRALGWSPARLRAALTLETSAVIILGTALGLGLARLFVAAALSQLGSSWSDAVAGLQFSYHHQPASYLVGALATVLISLVTIWFAARRLARLDPVRLLSGQISPALPPTTASQSARTGRRLPLTTITLVLSLIAAVALTLVGRDLDGESLSLTFFSAGSLLVVAGLCALSLFGRRQLRRQSPPSSLGQVGTQNVLRHPGRSLAAAGTMAAGVFMVIAFNAFRLGHDPAQLRSADNPGTGGFSLIATAALPLFEDLASEEAMEAFGLEPADLEGTTIVPFRTRAGDDASCLNLNYSVRPPLVAMDPARLASSAPAFTFAAHQKDRPASWDDLLAPLPQDQDIPTIPGIVDQNTAAWQLKLGLGDVIAYTGTRGEEFHVQIVALTSNSILQGRVLIAEQDFIRRFPDAEGYSLFLIRPPEDRQQELAALLNRQLASRGFAAEPALDLLARLNRVQNSYIEIFSALGALGVILGTLGFALLIARHVQERRPELALLHALGFRPREVAAMLFREHAILHLGGLTIGAVAALVALFPTSLQPGVSFPTILVLSLLTLSALLGLAVLTVASLLAGRRPSPQALRTE